MGIHISPRSAVFSAASQLTFLYILSSIRTFFTTAYRTYHCIMSLKFGQPAGLRLGDCFDDTERFFRRAPEGMPELQKLLTKSAEVGQELAKYSQLTALAKAFGDLDENLLDLSLDIRTGMRGPATDEKLLEYTLSETFLQVFAFHPPPQTTHSEQELQEKFEKDLQERWDHEAKPIRRLMKEFWNLWIPASEEIEERGKATRDLYRAFCTANLMLSDMKDRPLVDRYGRLSTIGTEDAKTIHSALSNFDGGAKDTYTEESARRMAELLCMWAAPQLRVADSSEDANLSSADRETSEKETTSVIKGYHLTGYDPTLISRYVLPRLGNVHERLRESIHHSANRLAIKSDLARRAEKPHAAKDLARAARLFKALNESIVDRLTEDSMEGPMSKPSVPDLSTRLHPSCVTQDTS